MNLKWQALHSNLANRWNETIEYTKNVCNVIAKADRQAVKLLYHQWSVSDEQIDSVPLIYRVLLTRQRPAEDAVKYSGTLRYLIHYRCCLFCTTFNVQ